jgi:hypothetical protein
MSWAVDRSRPSKRKKRDLRGTTDDLQVTRFDEYIRDKYTKRVTDVDEKSKILRDQLELKKALLVEIEDSESRGHIRQSVLLQRDINELRKKVEALDEHDLIQEFRATIVPYAQAYEREQQIAQMQKIRGASSSLFIDRVRSLPPMEQIMVYKKDESKVFKDYLEGVENAAPEVKVMHKEICEECDDIMILETRASVLTCPGCANWKPYLDATSSHMAYGEEVEFTSFAYLRLNHFNERLTYSQAKESNQVPDTVIDQVMSWLHENRVQNTDSITLDMTYNAMKDLKLRAYYKQNTQVWCRITGNPPLRMTPEHEEQLRLMFKHVQRLWPKYKPDNRKNFLSYNYCLYKFNEIMGYDDFLPYFKLLKGPKKLQKQDEIFEQICNDPELNWQFIPSRIN